MINCTLSQVHNGWQCSVNATARHESESDEDDRIILSGCIALTDLRAAEERAMQ